MNPFEFLAPSESDGERRWIYPVTGPDGICHRVAPRSYKNGIWGPVICAGCGQAWPCDAEQAANPPEPSYDDATIIGPPIATDPEQPTPDRDDAAGQVHRRHTIQATSDTSSAQVILIGTQAFADGLVELLEQSGLRVTYRASQDVREAWL